MTQLSHFAENLFPSILRDLYLDWFIDFSFGSPLAAVFAPLVLQIHFRKPKKLINFICKDFAKNFVACRRQRSSMDFVLNLSHELARCVLLAKEREGGVKKERLT